MRSLEVELKVGVGDYISALCHSVLRVEPYTSCWFGCAYCYARWKRSAGSPRPKPWLLRALEKLWSKLPGELRLPPFRLSTLVDPLQPLEEEHKMTLFVLRAALKHDVPIVLNTKSTLFSRGPWRGLLEEMASRGLVVLQISISTVGEHTSALLEPRALPGPERLEALSAISDEVPCVLRLQPLIPGLYEEEADDIIEEASRAGVKHVIVEFIRETPEGLRALYAKLGKQGLVDRVAWEPYGRRGRLLRPHLAYRREILADLRRRLHREGITVSSCKEGLVEFHNGRDCCGLRFLRPDRTAYRLTLYDVWASGGDLSKAVEEALRSGQVVFGPDITGYPNPIRKILRAHENRLLKILEDPEVLGRVCPALAAQVRGT